MPGARRTAAPVLVAALVLAGPSAALDRAEQLADAYVEAVAKVNDGHARRPKAATEEELAAELPRKAISSLEKLLELESAPTVHAALLRCGEAALDLARMEDFAAARARLVAESPEDAATLGTALARPRFLLRGLGGLDEAYLARFAEVLEGVLAGYDELFDFEQWSKVPGKKLRVRIHLEQEITRPPHFAPQFPWHSEIDFPVVDPERLRSPTADGKFLFYGLCHELGHVIAMWGDRSSEEDHHAWAHYTGVLLVEHLSETQKGQEWMGDLRDVRWRSLSKERERLAGVEPSPDDRDGVLALLIALHDAVGPRSLGEAINALDREDRRLRVHHVRYYTFGELGRALDDVVEDKAAGRRARELLD